jgi:Na+-transporting NADH:ubiquinone oxidoreductase subunit NqrF
MLEQRPFSVFYVCGPPDMTDSIVQQLKDTDGVVPEQVFCEKWW